MVLKTDIAAIRIIKALLYTTNILWSVFLVYESYKTSKANIGTIFTTLIIMLGSMVMNDLLKFKKVYK